MSRAPIKLRAEDEEDLAIIAACLQDALASLAEMSYDRAGRRFALVVKRFLWEEATTKQGLPTGRGLRARRAGLHFEGVSAVRYRGRDRRQPTAILELLTVLCDTRATPNTISLMFAGGAEIKVEADSLRCYMRDLELPHRTRLRPSHRIDGGRRS
ncbi:MAG: DUF2948 family protein [Alphaproteobacteria bacterium]|nr:DUF2948 family protein [Alphaproteobacteria bacterium]